MFKKQPMTLKIKIIKNMFLQKLKNIFTKPIFKFQINYKFLNPTKWNWQKFKEFIKIFLLTASLMLVFLLSYDIFINDLAPADDQLATDISDQIISYLDENNMGGGQSEEINCNAMGVNLHGFLSGYISDDTKNDNSESIEDQASSENIVFAIKKADKDDKIKAIILEVDSSGGFAVAGEEVANALKKAKKPTVAWIREQGLSAAYWSATGANTIFASTVSDVGSIGVTLSYLDNYKKNLKDGLTFNSLSTGKFKDTGNPDKSLTTEEKELIMRDLNIANEYFIKSVSINRKLDIEKVKKMADGSSMPGELALQNGLIDKIGGIYEIMDYLKEKIGEDMVICW